MTPHGILEDMRRFEQSATETMMGSMRMDCWRPARASIERAVHFNFSTEAWPEKEHADFAFDLIEAKMFRLPYPDVLCTSDRTPHLGYCAHQFTNLAGGTGLVIYTIHRVQDPPEFAGGGYRCQPMVAGVLDDLSGGTLKAASIFRGIKPSREIFGGAEEALLFVLGWTSLLMSKDVETRVEAAPAKLNNRREEQGRPLIRERRVVVIKPERRASYSHAAPEAAGLRSSPRMHWRRGHFRRIRDDRIVPVAPSIINGNANQVIKPKDYRIQ